MEVSPSPTRWRVGVLPDKNRAVGKVKARCLGLYSATSLVVTNGTSRTGQRIREGRMQYASVWVYADEMSRAVQRHDVLPVPAEPETGAEQA